MTNRSTVIKKTAATVLMLALFMSSFVLGVSEEYSTESDPLVSLSYINGVLTPQLETYVDDKVGELSADKIASELMKNEEFRRFIAAVASAQSGGSSGASGSEFTTIELTAGKKITATGKCELIIRSGAAAAVVKTNGAVKDLSTGDALKNGDAVVVGNFIELSFADGASGITILRTPSEVLIRGDYTIGE